jgi:hypothetical protein
MRIYNAKSSQINVPLTGSERLTVPAKSVSRDFMPNKEFLSLIVTAFDYSEIALIVSGPFEISMCSQVSCIPGFVVNSLEEAILRFNGSNDDLKGDSKNPALQEMPADEPKTCAKKSEKKVETEAEGEGPICDPYQTKALDPEK